MDASEEGRPAGNGTTPDDNDDDKTHGTARGDPPPPGFLDLGNGELCGAGTADDLRAAAAWLHRNYPEHSADPPASTGEPVILNMGASNVLAAYALYAGKVPPMSLNALLYMAVVSLDTDDEPWWSQGHAMLAIQAFGRAPLAMSGDEEEDRKAARALEAAVERAIRPLFGAGAITVDRHSSGHPGRRIHVRYRLWLVRSAPDELRARIHQGGLSEADGDLPAPHGKRGVQNSPGGARDISAPYGIRGAQTGRTLRIPSPHPTDSVTAPHGNRGTKEYEEYEERRKEEEYISCVADPVQVRAREDADDDGDSDHAESKAGGGAAAPLSEPAEPAASDAPSTPTIADDEHKRRELARLEEAMRQHPEWVTQ